MKRTAAWILGAAALGMALNLPAAHADTPPLMESTFEKDAGDWDVFSPTGTVTGKISITHEAAHVKEGILLPFLCGCGCNDLLCKNIQRLERDRQTIENTLTNSLHQRGALDEIITGGGKQSTFRQGAHPMAGSADALQRDRNGPR